MFATYSSGLKTGRDAWCYSSSRTGLTASIDEFTTQYREVQAQFAAYCANTGETKPSQDTATDFLAANPDLTVTGRISWNRGLRNDLAKGTEITFAEDSVRLGNYRPFNRQWTYLDRRVNDMIYQIPAMFPTPHHRNVGIYQVGNGSAVPFSVLMTDCLPDLHVTGAGSGGQFFTRWTYVKAESADGELDFASAETAEVDEYGYRRVDDITVGILTLYRDTVGDQVTKEDIFYYVYGLLHDPAYRENYAADLKKMLPHIPTPESRERFEQLGRCGPATF